MIGVPSGWAIQPGATLAPRRRAMRILLPATDDIDPSNTNGASSPAGAAKAIGLRPTMARAPWVGATCRPPIVTARPTMSWSRAMAAQ